jgi:hypothetical protein
MSNDDPVFFSSAFIEYLDNNFLSRKEKEIIAFDIKDIPE